MPDWGWIWLSGLLFAVQHSLLASQSCKQYFYRLGMSPTRYRCYFTLAGLLSTALWLVFVSTLVDAPLYQLHGPVMWLLLSLQCLGLLMVLLSLKPIDVGAFLGLRAFPEGGEGFVERGIYRHLRHPMYSGFMLILLASPVQSINSLNLALTVSLYFILGSRLEENRLQQSHAAYASYRQRVPAFIPGLHRFLSSFI